MPVASRHAASLIPFLRPRHPVHDLQSSVMDGLQNWQSFPTSLPSPDSPPPSADFLGYVMGGTASHDTVHVSGVVFGSHHSMRLLAQAVVALLSAATVLGLILYLAVRHSLSAHVRTYLTATGV